MDFEKLLLGLNGNFAVVIHKENLTFFAVDKLRTYPLLYSKKENNIYITDNIDSEWIQSLEPNLFAQKQLIDFWCVLNNDTLKRDLYQLQAGEYGVVEDNNVVVKNYFKHFDENKFKQSDEVVGELEKVQDVYFDKWYEQIKNKEVWVPLSGGFDSRYILAMLVKYGHANLHTYTYGKAAGFEAKTAYKVAKQLGVEWQFVEYIRSYSRFF
jgi:asparagine synthase (glutamine-hydrolysing)